MLPPTGDSTACQEDGYLGPAELVQTGFPLRARLDDGREVTLQLALSFPYQPALGDTLLALAGPRGAFAIGILDGAAPACLEFPGDVELRSVGGRLALRGDAGLDLEAPELTLRARVLRSFARTIDERADSALRWVKDLLTERLGESHRLVAGEDYSQCERSVTLAEDVVKVDARQLQLGH